MRHICIDGKTYELESGTRHEKLNKDGGRISGCGVLLMAGISGDPHRCDGRPGSSHDVSTCSRCEVRP